jgi:YHS domain-containing protein
MTVAPEAAAATVIYEGHTYYFCSQACREWFQAEPEKDARHQPTPTTRTITPPLFQRGWASVVNHSLNMFRLIAIGTGTAYGYSVVATLLPNLFPHAFRGHSGEAAVYFKAAAMITTHDGHRR